MKRLMLAVLASVCAFACAKAAIYLKSDAQGTGDGTSWSNAYTDWNTALNALNAIPEGGDRTLLIAKGQYKPEEDGGATPTKNVVKGTGFVIRGGYRAQSDDDTERDADLYPTIFTPMADVSTLKWKHIEVDPQTGAITETVTENPMFVGGVLQPHPAYTGDYDTYCADSWGGVNVGVKPLTVAAGASGTIDGIYFVKNGYPSYDQRYGVVQYQSSATENWLSNCTFVATVSRRGAINDSAGTSTKTFRHISNCRFISCVDVNKSGAGVHGGGNTIVEGCVFENNYCPTGYESSLLYTGGMDNDVRRCMFTRNVRVMSSTAQPAVVGAGSPSWQECTFTRNVGIGLDGACAPLLVSSARQGSSGNKNQTGEMRNSLIAENLVFCALKGDGNCYNLIGVNGRTRENVNNNINLDSSPAYVNCMFKANRLVASANELAAGKIAYMGILGNAYVDATLMNVWMSVIGCSFVSNSVEYAAGAEGATVSVSRGIAINSLASLSCQAGVANCTFLGPDDGTPDFRQNGSHGQVTTLLNCIFTTEDPNAVLPAFVSECPGSLNAIDCAAENMYPEFQPSGLKTLSGLVYDHIPVKEVAAGAFGNRALVPQVKVSDIRTSADISPSRTRDMGNNYAASFAYRTYENGKWGAWTELVSKLASSVGTEAGKALTDAFGTARTQNSMTRGAVQALDEAAEMGANLVLRRSPAQGGTLSSPANQAVASGAAIVPVTATTENSFAGWYDANDTLFSSDNPLVLDSLTSNLVLTAKFETQKTKLTFDLGEHGTFDETGTGICVIEASAHSTFPAVPAYTVEEGWYLVSWPAFPAVVPVDDATYAAKIVSKEKCVRYVAPTSRGTGDGTSPENATADFAAAYEEAGIYLGEVRLEGGTYKLAAPVRLRANVAVIGEEGASVVFSGDQLGDDYWKINNETAAGPVWTAGMFNEPNPDGADDFWVALSAGDDNTLYGFLNSYGETATNAVFRNVTFTGFARSAIRMETAAADGLVLDGCRFLANGTGRDATYAALSLVVAASATITNCAFTGNGPVYSTAFSEVGNTNVIAGCAFTANTGTVLDFNLGVHTNLFDVSGCTFARNYAPGAAILKLTGNAHLPGCRFADCTVTETRAGQNCVNISASAKSQKDGERLMEPGLTVERCSFTGTRGSGASNGNRGIILQTDGRYFWCDWVNCRFAENVCTNNYGTVAALVYNAAWHWHPFIGCTFENNEIVSTAEGGASTLLSIGGSASNQRLFGSVFGRNRLVAATSGNIGALGNFDTSDTSPNRDSLVAFSCVFDEDGIPPFCSSKAFSSARFRNCAVANADAVTCQTEPDYVDCYMGSAGVKDASTVGPNGVRSLGLRASTPCRLTGVPLWKRPSTGVYYWYDKTNTDPRYFYKVHSGSASGISKVTAASEGFGIGYPAVPDAFGAPRKVKVLQDAQYGDDPRTAPGPLNPDSMGLMILFR